MSRSDHLHVGIPYAFSVRTESSKPVKRRRRSLHQVRRKDIVAIALIEVACSVVIVFRVVTLRALPLEPASPGFVAR